MRRMASLALLGLALASTSLSAQGPGPMPGRGGPGAPGGRAGAGAASFLLANTGALELSDEQVVRLAGIARRAHERREALRAEMPRAAAPGGERARPSEEDVQRMRQRMEQVREQARADLRDALAVLTPDQQARAWEMMARRDGGGGRGVMRARRGPGMRGGPGGPGMPRAPRRAAPPAPGAGQQ